MPALTFDERELSRERMSRKRAAARDLHIPPPENPERRAACLADIYTFLQTYFSDAFYHPFTEGRREMVEAILQASHVGGDQGIAAPRGDGKTTIVECVTIYELLKGNLRFPIIVAATGPDAKRILSNIKRRFEDDASNELFHADFPEVCVPIVDLRGAPQKAGKQTVDGEPTFAKWSDDYVVFPRVPKKYNSAIAGAVLMTRGLDAAIRGIRHGSLRPDLAIIDDPETRESARSELQIANRETAIEQDIGGLGGPGRKLARVMLCTVSNRQCVAYKYTDPKQKPSWHGKRLARLVAKPNREDLWQDYCTIRQDELAGGGDGSKALAFYQEHRAEMDKGAIVTNPYDFVEPGQISALQKCYDIIADRGWDNFATEYQNDPPEDEGLVESGINARMIQRQLSGFPRGVIPPGCVTITHSIDVGKWKLHWVVRAWKPDATGYVIDYGIQDVTGAKFRSDEGLDRAIRTAILRRLDEFADSPYAMPDGEILTETLTLVDAGYRTDAVYSACASAGAGVYPVMGFGKSAGCIQANFSPAQRPNATTRPGDGWKMVRKGKVWLVEADADRWKAWEHDRWTTATDKPGCLFLFGTPSGEGERMSDDEKSHIQYANHICAEVEAEEVVKGVLRRKWTPKSKENHWLDASYYGNVAASIKGIRLPGPVVAKHPSRLPAHAASQTKPQPSERPSARDLAQRARKL